MRGAAVALLTGIVIGALLQISGATATSSPGQPFSFSNISPYGQHSYDSGVGVEQQNDYP